MNFNKEEYINILKMAQSNGYCFDSFNSKEKKLFLLRHDIDISPQIALMMAIIENELNIKATYFFMIRSPFYNIFSRANNKIINTIIELGHDIGLHYDEGYYSKEKSLQNLIDIEICMLEENFGIKITTVSFHQPSKKIIENTISIRQVNTYDNVFFKDIKYISDSNMIFKEDPIPLIESKVYSKIQLLIHPIWWLSDGKSTEDKFINAIEINFQVEQKQVLETERAYGAKKILDIKGI